MNLHKFYTNISKPYDINFTVTSNSTPLEFKDHDYKEIYYQNSVNNLHFLQNINILVKMQVLMKYCYLFTFSSQLLYS